MYNISLIYFSSGILGAVLIILVLLRDQSKKQLPFILLVLAASCYSLLYGVELRLTDPAAILTILRFEYIAIALVPPLWLIFILKYTGKQNILTPAVFLAIFAIPLAVIVTAFSEYFIPMLYSATGFITYDNLVLASIKPGPVYILNMLYMLSALIYGILLLVSFSKNMQGILKNQVRIIIAAGIILASTLLVYAIWFRPVYHIDITPIAFLFTLLMAFLAIFQYRLFSLVPVAYGTIFQKIPSGLVITDSHGYVIEANEAASTLLGTAVTAESGKKLAEFCSGDPDFATFMDKIITGDESRLKRDFSCQKDLKDKSMMTFDVSVTPVKDRHANTEGFIVLIRDITTEKAAEEEIKKSEQRFRSLFEQSPVAYVSLDREGRITGINPEFIHMTGYGWDEIKKTRLADLFTGKSPAAAEKLFHELLESDKIYTEVEIAKKDGSKITAMLSGRVRRDKNGIFLTAHCILHDITERKIMEESLQQANKKLNLLSNITRHDILNQLTILKGYQDLLSEKMPEFKDKDPAMTKYLEKEASATENIYQQITFTGDYQDIGVQAPVWQNAGDIFRKAAEGFRTKGVRITSAAEDVEIYADNLFSKVFYNLIENSFKYGGKLTEITLSYEIKDKSLVLKYTDNGTGIPDGEKENIFIRKYFKNSGLGMLLSREILAITGITIEEKGIFGEGASFEITVPQGVYRIKGET